MAHFPTTRWSILAAVRHDAPSQEGRRLALAALCQRYWSPIYALVRARGYRREDAQELTQEFFTRLLERGAFAAADSGRGRFRSWMRGALKNFLANEWYHATRVRRDFRKLTWIDEEDAEAGLHFLPANRLDPEILYSCLWGYRVVEAALDRLREQCMAKGHEELFNAVLHLLGPSTEQPHYAAIAEALGMSANHLRVKVCLLRHERDRLVREEIRDLVARREDVQEELQFLVRALDIANRNLNARP